MKKALFFLDFVSIASIGYGQQRVAVYAPEESKSGFDNDTKEFVIGEFVRAINQSNSYTAVNRSKEFERGISSERSYQHSGLVDEKEISKLGRASGASLVCVVVFRRVGMGDRNIEARLIDVEREEVIVSDNRIIKYYGAEALQEDAKAIAQTLMGNKGGSQTPVISRTEYLPPEKRLLYDNSVESRVSDYKRNKLKKEDVLSIMTMCPEAYQLFNSGHAIRDGWRKAEGIIGTCGAIGVEVCFFGWLLDGYRDDDGEYHASFNPDSKWLPVGVAMLGIALVDVLVTECIAVPIGNSKIKKAVETYNLQRIPSGYAKELRIGFTPTGVGLTLNF